MSRKTLVLFLVALYSVLVPLIGQCQWLSSEEHLYAWEILMKHELQDGSIFGNSIKVDTSLLHQTQRLYQRERDTSDKLISVLLRPLPKDRFQKETPPDGMSLAEREHYLKMRSEHNEALANAISAKIASAREILSFPGRYRFLKSNNDQLVEALDQLVLKDRLSNNPDLLDLFSLLQVHDSIAVELRKLPGLSLTGRALLKDTSAENQLIRNLDFLLRDSTRTTSQMILEASSALLIVNSVKTTDAFFKVLSSKKALYELQEVRDGKKYYKVHSVPFLMLLTYDRLNYSELSYFQKRIYGNPAVTPSMWPILYYSVVSQYLSKKYLRPIRITSAFDVRMVIL